MQRRKAREYALQILFRLDFTEKGIDSKDLEEFWSDKEALGEVRKFAEELVRGTLNKLDDLDTMIEKVTENWLLKRMAAVDRNILRLSAYELFYKKDIPPAVTINEAIEIAKKFSSTESAPFINGVLDKLARELGKS